ncbi:unnamed protein product [Zymoseptoria tritici ST99CH_1A5]|uniref:Uncharacterized protein n=1 Tax=Zymoseptoria tritici ST99CH_1A5 TaxID=1276529 RepID=A0A1Y6LB23_ZYMTR|nr:unnamed protein product [Zymoseptoria tritici ST99CH_1A5]
MELWRFAHQAMPNMLQAQSLSPRPPGINRGLQTNNARITVQEYTLLSFLPGLYRQIVQASYDTGAVIDHLVSTSPEIWPRTGWNPLYEAELADAYLSIIRTLARSSSGEADIVVSEALMSKLEGAMALDNNDTRMRGGRFIHRRSQHLFRCLAEVSHQAKSSKIGNVLAQFFYRYASEIASVDQSSALCQWCYALLRATTRDVDRYDCLKRVLRVRPDLPAKIAGSGNKAHKVAQLLDRVAANMSRRELKPRVEALDWRYPEVRERSRSRGRQLTLSDGRRPSDLGYLDEDDVLALRALQAERVLIAREEEGRRMLQLTLGRHYNNRLDTVQDGGLGDVGDVFIPRAALPLSLNEAEIDI